MFKKISTQNIAVILTSCLLLTHGNLYGQYKGLLDITLHLRPVHLDLKRTTGCCSGNSWGLFSVDPQVSLQQNFANVAKVYEYQKKHGFDFAYLKYTDEGRKFLGDVASLMKGGLSFNYVPKFWNSYQSFYITDNIVTLWDPNEVEATPAVRVWVTEIENSWRVTFWYYEQFYSEEYINEFACRFIEACKMIQPIASL